MDWCQPFEHVIAGARGEKGTKRQPVLTGSQSILYHSGWDPFATNRQTPCFEV